MVHLVALLQATQDRDGVFHGRLADVDLLEATFECGVLFYVGAVFVERRRADHAQLTASEHRLHHVSCVHRTLCPAGANQRVDLIDEGDDFAASVGDFLQHGLQSLLKFAAVLRAGEHGAEVERHESLRLEALRHVARSNALSESFDDGCLADARFADENRVVLGSPRQHLHDATNFFVATDDRVDLACTGTRSEVDAVLLQGLELVFGVLRSHPMRAAHFTESREHLVPRHTDDFVHREHQ